MLVPSCFVLPSCLLVNLSYERPERCLAWLKVTTRNVPAPWKEHAVVATPVNERATIILDDDGANNDLRHVAKATELASLGPSSWASWSRIPCSHHNA
jgi:hypothetical protein